ncbi:hypothetical protein IJJ54_00585 [Candidatus Saccharibacteria bacterium]|nr:hypothetical protein [Candidatus Saccharibacteria bacterium]
MAKIERYYSSFKNALTDVKCALTECKIPEADHREVLRLLTCPGIDLTALDSALRTLEYDSGLIANKRQLAADCAKIRYNLELARVIMSFTYLEDNERMTPMDRADINVAYLYMDFVLKKALKYLHVYY